MGSIEFLGFLDDSFTFGDILHSPKCQPKFIGTFENFNVMNWLLFWVY